jgi:hypothetical protein
VKPSTSNRYHPLILLRFKSVCKQQDLEAQVSEAQVSEDSKELEASDSPQFCTIIGHKSPIAISEANAVSRQREKLLLDAIEDMVTSSTNPSVSAIGLQSLAGLPTSLSPVAVPNHLWAMVRSTLWDMVDPFQYREFLEHQIAVAERLFRALLHLSSLDSTDEALAGTFFGGRMPHSHRVMALEGLFSTEACSLGASGFSWKRSSNTLLFKQEYYIH